MNRRQQLPNAVGTPAATLLRAIVDSSDDAILSKDLTGTITSWNKGVGRLFGYTASEVIGKPITILIPPDRLNEEADILRRLLRGEDVSRFETVRRRKDGLLLDVSLTIAPVRDARGKIIGATNIARDITERKRNEQTIQELNAQLTSDLSAFTWMQQLSTRLLETRDFSLLLERIIDGAVEITRADMGNIQLFRDDVLKIVAQRGFDTPFLDFFNSVQDGLAACGVALQRGERVIVEDVENSPIFAGTPALDVMLSAGARGVQSTPLVSRSGQVLGMFSTHYRAPCRPDERALRMLDILARQAADLIEGIRAEEALRHSEALFRQLAEAAPNAMIMVGTDGLITLANAQAEKLFGYHRCEMLGRPVEILVPERFRSKHGGHRSAFFAAPAMRAMGAGRDLFGARKDGTEMPIEIGLNPDQHR